MKRLICSTVAAIALAVGLGLACGPDSRLFETVRGHVPASRAEYAKGDLGVVHPGFARRYLVHAFRTMNGRPVVAAGVFRPWELNRAASVSSAAYPPTVREQWIALLERLEERRFDWQERGTLYGGYRQLPNYQSFANCLDDAYATAVRTLNARIERWGEKSREVADWVAAQRAVFRNCDGSDLVAPAAAPAWADAVLRADRNYQIAAAHFYATRYERASALFRDIATDGSSPWQPYGRYLAARATIRQATVPDNTIERTRQLLGAAEGELRAVLADPGLQPVHASAAGLLDYVAIRLHPADRLVALGRKLAEADTPTDDDFTDYRDLMDVYFGERPSFTFTAADRTRVRSVEVTDWVVAMQADGDAAVERAVQRWRETQAPHWLIAALWRVPPRHAAAAALLEAGALIQPPSPAYATVTVARIRLLLQRGDGAAARAALAALPAEPTGTIGVEVLNVLRAARLRFADTFDEFVVNAARASLEPGDPSPVLDEDAAAVMNRMFTLDRLVETALDERLAPRLRVRVASAAFTRAVVLRRSAAALQVAPALRELAPSMRADIDTYVAAPDDTSRHRAGLLTLLRTTGLSTFVLGVENELSAERAAPARAFDRRFAQQAWWCPSPRPGAASELTEMLHGKVADVVPPFLSAAERAQAAAELKALADKGIAIEFLSREAIAWTQAAPADQRAAEALAQAVEGWRRSWCPDVTQVDRDLSPRAFALLHRQFPGSTWAKQTPYWYR